ncbi:nucleotidyltransferase domain-containing protein [Prosthecomicrobium sp. N25]|uniref:nucleotidyltransferase domain-containing protein n=1 Tax=Prosthecomicrobium sp. N25 TaxID=3129254 RepID=UPI00307711E2
MSAAAPYADVEPDEIRDRLAAVAAEEDARVLLAVESGSRAWGFASPDSDWDTRFVYTRPLRAYLSLDPPRDVVERPLDARGIDLAGWDVRKALVLLLASNPTLLEWLHSPIAYVDDGRFRPAALDLFARFASRRALAHHYRSIARTHWSRSLATGEEVRLRRYFYVVRSVAALAWVAAGRDLPPMNLFELLDGSDLPADVRRDLDDLLALKTSLPEFGDGPRRPALDRYILDVVERVDPAAIDDRAELRPAFRAEADTLFRTLIGFED